MTLSALPTPAVHLQEWAVWLAALATGILAAGAIGRRLHKGAKIMAARWRAWEARFDALDNLVQHELRPNTGSSIKDAVQRVERRQERHLADAARVAGQIEARLGRLEDHMGTAAEAQAALWPAIQAVAEATPHHTSEPDPWPEDDQI